ncbi:hypothetical protein NDU88_002893 [Pleurodeles waltl]|uniref:Uncharacterized protein n=1 Tax=Pleurodeles waltl TaxID=8319 RepID=A0AAV7T388_PLEWA|nr:hypothetical protein NDU88_002893 [Pleurodeles waltl]
MVADDIKPSAYYFFLEPPPRALSCPLRYDNTAKLGPRALVTGCSPAPGIRAASFELINVSLCRDIPSVPGLCLPDRAEPSRARDKRALLCIWRAGSMNIASARAGSVTALCSALGA